MPLSKFVSAVTRLYDRVFRRDPEQPEDPYAYVMAPKKRPPLGRSAAAVLELPDE